LLHNNAGNLFNHAHPQVEIFISSINIAGVKIDVRLRSVKIILSVLPIKLSLLKNSQTIKNGF